MTDLPDDEDLHIWGTFIKDVDGTLMMFICNRVNNDFSSLPPWVCPEFMRLN